MWVKPYELGTVHLVDNVLGPAARGAHISNARVSHDTEHCDGLSPRVVRMLTPLSDSLPRQQQPPTSFRPMPTARRVVSTPPRSWHILWGVPCKLLCIRSLRPRFTAERAKFLILSFDISSSSLTLHRLLSLFALQSPSFRLMKIWLIKLLSTFRTLFYRYII